MACGAVDRIFALWRPASIAGAACILPGDFDLCFEAEGCFAERNFQIVAEIRTPLRASSPSSTAEDIAEPEEFT
jgi:hypothetical protein